MVDYNVANIRVRSLRMFAKRSTAGQSKPLCLRIRRSQDHRAGGTFLSDDHVLLEAFLILALDVSYAMVNQRCRSGSNVNYPLRRAG